MKIRFIALGILFLTLSGCGDCKKKLADKTTELDNIKKELDSCKAKTQKSIENICSIDPYVPRQKIREIKSNERDGLINLKPDKKFNSFNLNNDKIKLQIPVTDDNLKIIDIINVSSKKINAIVILLNGIEGEDTDGKPLTHFITSKKAKISKVNGLEESLRANNDNKLLAIVVHDDKFYSDNLKVIIKNLINDAKSDYEEARRNIKSYLPKKTTKDGFEPREEEDDILNGGG